MGATHLRSPDVIAIGASTGGTGAIKTIVENLSATCPPVVVTIHMPAGFTCSFAKRLQATTILTVKEALSGEYLQAGSVYIAPGDTHLLIKKHLGKLVACLDDSAKVSGHRPSVDVMFQSIAQSCNAKAMGVILTGMGKDGAAGLHAMKSAGAYTIAQDEASSVVYGMPKAAVAANAHCVELDLQDIADCINRYCVAPC